MQTAGASGAGLTQTKKGQHMINLTDTAVTEVMRLQEKEGLKEAALRLGVMGGGCSGLQYAMNFDKTIGENDQTFEFDGVTVVCDAKAYLYLNGITIDYSNDMMGGGFKFENPNAVKSCGCGTSFKA
jgi:iron-sulfur cluster assembly protein